MVGYRHAVTTKGTMMASKIDSRKFHAFLESQTGMEHDITTVALALAFLPQFSTNGHAPARRGRPPKAEALTVSEAIIVSDEPAAEAPRRRGRPPGSKNKPREEPKAPVRRGRPPAQPRPEVIQPF